MIQKDLFATVCGRNLALIAKVFSVGVTMIGCGPSAAELDAVDYTPQSGGMAGSKLCC